MRSKGQRSLSSENENVNIVFRTCRRQKWIDLCQTKIRMIIGPFYTYRPIHFISENASFY